MKIVHLRNLAFWNQVVPNCNTKDKDLITNITLVTCEECRYSQEGRILEADRIRKSF